MVAVAGPGKLIIISGPSGAGKSTVVRQLIALCPLPISLSVSVTTRAPRTGEIDGVDYHFVSVDQFMQLRRENAFLECKEVFGRGDWYGTLRDTVETGLRRGQWILLEIDVQGAISVMEQRPDALSFFVHPGSLNELESRLRKRATDSEEAILRRLQVAADELRAINHYRFEIINREVEQSVDDICRLLQEHNQEGKNARST